MCLLSPLEIWMALNLNKLNSLFSWILCVKCGWNWPSGSEEDFQNLSIYFQCVAIIFPLDKGQSLLFESNLTPNPKMFCASFGWNWPGGSWEEVVNLFLLLNYHFPLTKEKKLELSSPRNALGQVWWNLTRWFWKKKWMDTWTDRQTDRQ